MGFRVEGLAFFVCLGLFGSRVLGFRVESRV